MIFLWFISQDPRLPDPTREAICDPGNEVFLSVVSIWEAIVKYQLGKLSFPYPPEEYLPTQRDRHGILSLPLDEASVVLLARLPSIHRDPFDRMFICQAMAHGLIMVTADEKVAAYPIRML
jgi:PIN domain nuclease of toxin-antitoxin system